ncbi:MAG TPA: diacylglycerol kinase family protein [Anaerolineales bacterium]|nr:diacylglycerol kinase family protein [Anaerolineales bacterium]
MTIKEFIQSRIISFGHAFRGWRHVLKTQHNAWVHTVVAGIVFILAIWLKLPARDWAVIILTVTMVFTAEFINTAIEAVVDLASPVHHPLAKVGKDVGAAAVLIAALAAVLVGFLILAPPLWGKVGVWFGQSQQISRSEETAFKGMELYSWQDENGLWQYAILAGTNRNKTLEEVQATPLDLQSVQIAITRMPAGESLFWMDSVYDARTGQSVTLPFPPGSVIDELTGFCREKQVDLYVP